MGADNAIQSARSTISEGHFGQPWTFLRDSDQYKTNQVVGRCVIEVEAFRFVAWLSLPVGVSDKSLEVSTPLRYHPYLNTNALFPFLAVSIDPES